METSSPPPIQSREGFVHRIFRWLFRWRTIRRALIVFAGLFTLAALLVTEENWRCKRAWEKFKSEWEAKGERFDLASFIPKPVPVEQNFVATPFLAPLLDFQTVKGEVRLGDSNGIARVKSMSIGNASTGNWKAGKFCDLGAAQKLFRSDTNFPTPSQPQDPARDVLFALQKYDSVLAELRAASQRPFAVYSTHPGDDLPGMMEHYIVLKSLTRVIVLHSLAELEAGENEEALADVKLALHLGQSLQSELLLMSQLVRIALLNISLQPVWEGLAKHRWATAQLEELQNLLSSFQLLEDYGSTMRGERAFSNELMSHYIAGRFAGTSSEQQSFKLLRFLGPRGFYYQNQLVINRLHQQLTFPAVDAAAHRVYPEKCDTNALAAALGRHTPYNMFARMLFPAFQKTAVNFAATQTSFDQAVVACALERYRLANEKYPETLNALIPKFMDKLPNDVINGQPLHYKLANDGSFVLYSVGWNGKDDDGVVARKKGSVVDSEQGDWVWGVPLK